MCVCVRASKHAREKETDFFFLFFGVCSLVHSVDHFLLLSHWQKEISVAGFFYMLIFIFLYHKNVFLQYFVMPVYNKLNAGILFLLETLLQLCFYFLMEFLFV